MSDVFLVIVVSKISVIMVLICRIFDFGGSVGGGGGALRAVCASFHE